MTRNVLFASLVGVFLVVGVGLQVRRRQVGLARGTRWPVGSSAGRMVARTTRWSHGRFHGWASKPRLSRDYVGVGSWVVIGRGYTEFEGFPVVRQKTTRLLSWSTKPRPKTGGSSTRTGLTGGYQSGRWGTPVWPVCDDAVRRLRSGGYASGSQGLHRGWTSLWSSGIHPMVLQRSFSKGPSGACILV
jgi:hypothetical protein